MKFSGILSKSLSLSRVEGVGDITPSPFGGAAMRRGWRVASRFHNACPLSLAAHPLLGEGSIRMNQRHTALAASTSIALASVCAVLMSTTAFAQAPVDAAFEAAQILYDKGDYGSAYIRYAELADAGHAEASRIAWLMSLHGQRLYGRTFEATPPQQRSWRWRMVRIPGCAEAKQPPELAVSGC